MRSVQHQSSTEVTPDPLNCSTRKAGHSRGISVFFGPDPRVSQGGGVAGMPTLLCAAIARINAV